MSHVAEAKLVWDWTSGARDESSLRYFEQFAEGAEDNQADAVWHVESQVLTDGSIEVLDLGALVREVLGDAGYALAFTRIKAIHVIVENTAAGDLIVGAAAWDPWYRPFGGATHTVIIPPDSNLMLTNRIEGWAVDTCDGSSSSSSGECGTQRNLALQASGGDVTYSIAILGTLTDSSSSGA